MDKKMAPSLIERQVEDIRSILKNNGKNDKVEILTKDGFKSLFINGSLILSVEDNDMLFFGWLGGFLRGLSYGFYDA